MRQGTFKIGSNSNSSKSQLSKSPLSSCSSASGRPLLDISYETGRKHKKTGVTNDWSSKQKRCWSRLKLIFKYCRWKKDKLRFLTLTSSPNSPDIHKSFRKLIKRIRRRFDEFEYLAVKTSEGYGVYHIIYKGKYIPQGWLQANWMDIHNAKMVNIKFIRNHPKKLANYVVSQYMSSQQGFNRYSWSWNIVFRGFVGQWKKALKLSGFDFDRIDSLFNGNKIFIERWEVYIVIESGQIKFKQLVQAPLFYSKLATKEFKQCYDYGFIEDV